MRKPLRSCLVSTLAVSCCLAWTIDSQASGFSTARFGAEHGTPVSPNPTAIYYNPAALAQSPGLRVFLDVSTAFRRATYTHRPAEGDVPEPPGAEGANVGEGKLFNVLAVPMVGVSYEVFPKFVVGLGTYIPFGGTSVWDENERFEDDPRYPGLVDGVARWYSIEGTIQSMYFTLAAAYEIPDTRLSIGASGNLIHSVVHTIRARTAALNNDIATEGRSYVDVDGWQGSFGVGLMYEALDDELWLGASYQSRPNVSGGMELEGTLKNYFTGSESDDPVKLEQDLPDIIRVGARWRTRKDLELRLFGDYTRWSALEHQCVVRRGSSCDLLPDGSAPDGSQIIQNLPRDWQDAFGVRAGVSYWPDDPLELMVGTGYDSNAIPSEHLDPALMDFHDVMLALGARWNVIDPLFAALTYTQFYYFPRDTNGESINDNYPSPSTSPDAGGRYTQFIGVLNANVELVF